MTDRGLAVRLHLQVGLGYDREIGKKKPFRCSRPSVIATDVGARARGQVVTSAAGHWTYFDRRCNAREFYPTRHWPCFDRECNVENSRESLPN